MTSIKICGLSTPETVQTAINAGADFLGFVFYPPSPRHVSPKQAADLIKDLPPHVRSVGLFVDPTDEDIENALKHPALNMIQLHGSETPERLKEIQTRFNLPLIKAIRVGAAADLIGIEEFEPHCDWLLFDAKPKNADLPGGTGHTFDWSILDNLKIEKPWMLSGGLTVKNLSEALLHLKPPAVDVSSGVESTRGTKDADKIIEFIQTVKKN